MAQSDVMGRVKEVVVRALGLAVGPEELGDDESLFGEGTGADSMASLQIVFALEEEFGIQVEDEELRVEIFDSVRSLAQLVEGKLEAGHRGSAGVTGPAASTQAP
ncbi:MAG: acyl carrier protein [Candidatus Latescibacterota bacterium]